MSLTDPPMQEVQTLLQALQPHAEEFGFFLHWGRFCQHIAGVSPPAPVLRMSVYVWGAHLRGPSSSTLHEADFLQRALSYTTLPPEEHLNEVVEVAQAHVLLSTYFFRQDRVTEGHYHLGIAVSLVMAVRMHKVGPVSVGGVSTGSTQPVGQVDEGERIRAFWTVFFLSTCWSASSNLGSAITSDNGAQVDAPWPLEMSQYGRGIVPPAMHSGRTLQAFCSSLAQRGLQQCSSLALLCQASFLYERVVVLAAQYRPNAGQAELNRFHHDFASYDNLLERFRTGLPRIENIQARTPSLLRTHIMVRCLNYIAIVCLHSTFVTTSVDSWHKTTLAARSFVKLFDLVDIDDIGPINTIIGTLWPIICQALFSSTSQLRAMQGVPNALGISIADTEALIEQAFAFMALLSFDDLYMNHRLREVQNVYNSHQ